jgi:hypothetical protein
MFASLDDPARRCARQPRPAGFRILSLSPRDPQLGELLDDWNAATLALLARGVDPATRHRLEDSRRIVGELSRVLAGEEEGEGASAERLVRAAVARDRVQAVATLFICRRAAFIELLASAPWNLLGPDDPPDPRAIRGAGRVLIGHASALSRAAHAGGRVALQAENPRCVAFYERLGFFRMCPSDAPLALVPRGDKGWSPGVLRLARGAPGPDERRAPWMLLDPGRLPPMVARPPPFLAAARALTMGG